MVSTSLLLNISIPKSIAHLLNIFNKSMKCESFLLQRSRYD